MKRFYFIFPTVLLVVFCALYMQFSAKSDAAEAEKAQKVAQAKLEEEAKKKEAEDKSRKDSEARTAARAAEEQKKEEERLAKWDAESKKIADETKQYAAQVVTLTADVAALEKQLTELKATKDTRTRDLLNASAEVEMAAIAKHNQEMEIQRMTEMLVRRAALTSLVKQ